MGLCANEIRLGSLSSCLFPGAYDQDKLGLGALLVQQTGGNPADKWAGLFTPAVARPMEQPTAIPSVYPKVVRWSDTIDWVFVADNASAATTRRISVFGFSRTTWTFTWWGFITLPTLSAGNRTIRDMIIRYAKYTTGTVAVSGTGVTGSGTAWSSSRLCVGSRIGFGSTDPAAISTWYQISAVGSDTSITLTASAGTISAGTAYVIEELWVVTAETNVTATNGGLFAAKGLRIENFVPAGYTVPAATTTDNIKAFYWLADASTVLNTVSNGMGDQGADSWTQHFIWVGNGTTTQQLFKYNIKAALSGLSSGKSVSAYVLKTAASATLTGTASQVANGCVATPNHGPGSGVACYYFTTTTRVYRTKALSTIVDGDTSHITGGDQMSEVPPGSVYTFSATAVMGSIHYSASFDRFFVMTSGASGARSYFTQYRIDSGQMNRIFFGDTKQLSNGSTSSDCPAVPNSLAITTAVFEAGGVLFLAPTGTALTNNNLFAIPIGADFEFEAATGNVLVTPRIATPMNNGFRRVYVNSLPIIGGSAIPSLGVAPEGYLVYYRTSGISGNTGSWQLLDPTGDLSGVGGADYIQFKIAFRILSPVMVPARIAAIGVLYENLTTDSHYQASVGQSSLASKRFSWRHSVAFGSTVPRLRVRLYDAVSGGLLVDDDSVTQAGTWEKSTNDGGAWGSYDSTDKGNETTYIRFTPASLGDNIKVLALLTQY